MIKDKSKPFKRALLLDRDGVVNIDYGYVHKIDQFEFIDGIFDLARAAHINHYTIVIVTNQSGIGRGYYSEHEFNILTEWMCQKFKESGALISRVYHSPYHPTLGQGKYKVDHPTRKPNPGMITDAAEELGLALERSILIGDKPSDICAGVNAGVGKNLLFSTDTTSSISNIKHTKIRTLHEAIPYLSS